jgi:NitT/TauT family transport system permease protein
MTRFLHWLYQKRMILVSALAIIAIWYLLLWLTNLPVFILPSPGLVVDRFLDGISRGRLLYHIGVTVLEFLSGLLFGSLFAIIMGYLIAHSSKVEEFISPILAASQAIPVVAIAPLFVLWLGPGIWSKILVCAIIIFFPVLVNTVHGLKNLPPNYRALLSTLGAGKKDYLYYLEIPATLPIFLNGLKIGATLSVTGAVVGEFLGADRGLGYLINLARGQYDTAYVFAIIGILVILALGLYNFVELLERFLLHTGNVKESHEIF